MDNVVDQEHLYPTAPKILIISQGNFAQYYEALPELDPSEICFIAEKKSAHSIPKKNPFHITFVEEYFESGELEYVAYQLHKNVPFQLIIATSETDILRAAQLRSTFNILGQSHESAVAFRDKVRMKELISQAGLPVPKFSPAESATDVLNFIHQNGFPVIIKPKRGYGSHRTKLLKNEDNVREILTHPGFFTEFQNGNFDVEEFILGDMYHVDGLVHKEKLTVCWPSKFINNCLQMTQGKPLSSYLLPQEHPLASRLTSYAWAVLKALKVPENTCFHLELFHRGDQFIICEIASRVGGLAINDVWKEGLGIDLKKEFIRAQAFLSPSKDLKMCFSQPITGRIIFPPQKGKVIACPRTCSLPNVLQYTPTIEEGDALTSPTDILNHMALFIFTANTEPEVSTIVQSIEKWVQENIKFGI